MKEFATTVGELRWDDSGVSVERAEDPSPPEGEGWEMCGSVLGAMRFSCQPMIWFWRRDRIEAVPKMSPSPPERQPK